MAAVRAINDLKNVRAYLVVSYNWRIEAQNNLKGMCGCGVKMITRDVADPGST
jgi:hypothetical protein